jgi:hypothetical protein
MVPKRFIDAFRERMSKSVGGASTARPWIAPVPPPNPPAVSWRRRASRVGPYTRYSLYLPHDWAELPGAEDVVRAAPSYAIDQRLTLVAHSLPVSGPQGLLDACEAVLDEGRSLAPPKGFVRLARWGEDGWAASWGWLLPATSARARGAWRILALGNEQGVVIATMESSVAELDDVTESILGCIELPPADLLAPEFFTLAIIELLNDRAGDLGGNTWFLDEKGLLVGGAIRIHPTNAYRSYLNDGDLDALASRLDARAHHPPGEEWIGLEWADVQESIRVVLRPRTAVEELDIVWIPIAPSIVACPVLDSRDRITFIPNEEVQRWGLDGRSLLSWAVARQDSGTTSWIELRDDTDLLQGVQLSDGEAYDSGLLLSPSVRENLEAELGSPLLVAMPTAECIHVWRDTADARRHLAVRAHTNYRRRPRPLSDDLWLWTEEGLIPVRA